MRRILTVLAALLFLAVQGAALLHAFRMDLPSCAHHGVPLHVEASAPAHDADACALCAFACESVEPAAPPGFLTLPSGAREAVPADPPLAAPARPSASARAPPAA